MNDAFLPARIGTSWLLVDAGSVREVVRPVPWVPLAGGPRGFPGVLAWSGRAVAVCDLARLLETDAEPLAPSDTRARTIIVSVGEDVVALPVDEVREARDGANAEDRRSDVEGRAYVAELQSIEGTWMARIDLGKLLDDARRGART